MKRSQVRPAYVLSAIVAILAAVASAGGLFTGLYRDNSLTTAAWRGNDLVTLAVAVPSLILASVLALRGSRRAQLVWLGGLGYMLYNYMFYLYGAALNRAFLLYVALVTLSLYALILGLVNLDAEVIGRKFRDRTPVKGISLFMLAIPLIMGMVELQQVMPMVLSGEVHPDIAKFNHPTAVVQAADFTLLFPALIVAAALLWKRRPWGYIMATILMFKGAAYTLALVFMSYFAATATGSGDPLVPFYAAFCLGGLLSLGFLLGNLEPEQKQASPARQRRFVNSSVKGRS